VIGEFTLNIAQSTQRLARERRKAAKRKVPQKISSRSLLRYVKARLQREWSPEQIAGRLKRDLSKHRMGKIFHVSSLSGFGAISSQAATFTSTFDSRILIALNHTLAMSMLELYFKICHSEDDSTPLEQWECDHHRVA